MEMSLTETLAIDWDVKSLDGDGVRGSKGSGEVMKQGCFITTVGDSGSDPSKKSHPSAPS